VSLGHSIKQPHLPALENEQWLVECLKHSGVRLIRIVPDLGEPSLKFWAEACDKASKSIFLRLSAAAQLPSSRCPLRWWLKRLIDWSAATLLLLTLSPVMLGLACLVRLQSPEPIFYRQWCVGERGKLFRLLKFRTMVMNTDQSITPLGRWMRKYSLDELPQLFNVLRFEISLVGPRPWILSDAVQISPEFRQQLNALPGIIAKQQKEARSNLLDLDALRRCNLEYLRCWSLWQDLKILLLTISKVFSGGAY
jgi:lipopolysaccharide/colanic/teichoic acid biosynthesis glycosyltransferase